MVGSKIGHDSQFQSENGSVFLDGDLDVINLVAAMYRGEKILATSLNPLQWPSKLHCQEAEQGLLAIDVQLTAESAANFRHNHAHVVLRQVQHDGDLSSKEVRNLGRGPQGE